MRMFGICFMLIASWLSGGYLAHGVGGYLGGYYMGMICDGGYFVITGLAFIAVLRRLK